MRASESSVKLSYLQDTVKTGGVERETTLSWRKDHDDQCGLIRNPVFMFFYRMPKWVEKGIDSMRRNFL